METPKWFLVSNRTQPSFHVHRFTCFQRLPSIPLYYNLIFLNNFIVISVLVSLINICFTFFLSKLHRYWFIVLKLFNAAKEKSDFHSFVANLCCSVFVSGIDSYRFCFVFLKIQNKSLGIYINITCNIPNHIDLQTLAISANKE